VIPSTGWNALAGLMMEDKTRVSPQPEVDRGSYDGRSPMDGWHRSAFFKLMVVAPILAVMFSWGLVKYRDYIGGACERAAQGDLSRLGAAIERLGNEMGDLNCPDGLKQFSEEHISYLAGPYYGWGGTNRKCKVRIRMIGREIQGCSKRGTRPTGKKNKTYIYRISVDSGRDLKPTVGACTGKRYGYPMYTSTMLPGEGKEKCVLGPPTDVKR